MLRLSRFVGRRTAISACNALFHRPTSSAQVNFLRAHSSTARTVVAPGVPVPGQVRRETFQERFEQIDKTADGNPEKHKKQHAKGKLTARERLSLLLDEDSFFEYGKLRVHQCSDFGMEKKRVFGDGVVTGRGTINGRPVFVYSQDFTALAGTVGDVHASKIIRVMDQAKETGAPIIGLYDSGGVRIHEGVQSMARHAELFRKNVLYSGVVPQLAMIMGPNAGGGAYSSALMDFCMMVKRSSFMYISSPVVVEQALNEKQTHESLGGVDAHTAKSGVAHMAADNDIEALLKMRELVDYLPLSHRHKPPHRQTSDSRERLCPELDNFVPLDPSQPFDVRHIINRLVDENTFFEIHEKFAANIVVGFSRMDGHTVGIVANQPKVLAGCLDIDASVKCARFVRFCDAFNIPVLTFVDVPGYLPGSQQEWGGILRHGAKMLYAYSEATVPMVTVILRKGYGGAFVALSATSLRADLAYAWPTAEIAVMGVQAAAGVMFRPDDFQSRQDFVDRFGNAMQAAELGEIEAILRPRETRRRLIADLEVLRTKRRRNPSKKHGNMPL